MRFSILSQFSNWGLASVLRRSRFRLSPLALPQPPARNDVHSLKESRLKGKKAFLQAGEICVTNRQTLFSQMQKVRLKAINKRGVNNV